jgi:hypothetical protein
MGRPLNKKYFGNRNIGSSTSTTDSGIGGTSVDRVTLGTLGSYTVRPTITFSDPDLLAEGAETATGTVVSEVLSATVVGGNAGSGYLVTDVVSVGSATFSITVNGGGAITGLTPVNRGSFTALAAGAQAVTGGTGTLATIVITYRAKSITITKQGSGYSHSVDATASFAGSATLPGTPTVNMLVDTGIVGTAGNQENAISMTAQLPGGSAGLVDIIKQVSGRRYKVTDGTRIGIVQLQDSAVSGDGQATIVATDASSATYYVTKLTAHKATLTQISGSYEFASGTAVAWTMNGTTGTKAYPAQPYLATGVNVQIANT